MKELECGEQVLNLEAPGFEILSQADRWAKAGHCYHQLRVREGRLLPDAIVADLPKTPPGFSHPYEWRVRANSTRRLTNYLKQRKSNRSILDLGCGNGWLTAHLASTLATEVIGLDIHREELTQATRVFGSIERVRFAFGDIFEDIFPKTRFDSIIVAGVISYFPDLNALVERLLGLLAPQGEIHILESPLFEKDQIQAAKTRSQAYLDKVGFSEMKDHYHYHPREALNAYKPTIHYQPKGFKNFILSRCLRQAPSPFPWLSISKS